MPLKTNAIQPEGFLHGGACAAFADTLASLAGSLAADVTKFHVAGQEINANRLRAGIVGEWFNGTATPAHPGSQDPGLGDPNQQ